MVAGAGTGKTTTLVMLADSLARPGVPLPGVQQGHRRRLRRRFPANVVCSTAHSLAYQATGRAFRRRLNSPRLASADIAAILGIDPLAVPTGTERLPPLGRPTWPGVAMQAVKNFAH